MKKTDEYSFVLRPSKTEGVGVFATHAIVKDTHLRLFPAGSERKLSKVKRPFGKYCYRKEKKEICPLDFGRMSIGWYLNHSSKPNAYHKKYEYYALRDIKRGEEITINYNTL